MTDKDEFERKLATENAWDTILSLLTWLLILSILFVSLSKARLPCIFVQPQNAVLTTARGQLIAFG